MTSLYVGLQGTFYDRKKTSGKGSKTKVPKQLYLDLLHDGRLPDPDPEADGDIKYKFAFLENVTLLTRNTYWYKVGDILKVATASDLREHIDYKLKWLKDARGVTPEQVEVIEHNLMRLRGVETGELL